MRPLVLATVFMVGGRLDWFRALGTGQIVSVQYCGLYPSRAKALGSYLFGVDRN